MDEYKELIYASDIVFESTGINTNFEAKIATWATTVQFLVAQQNSWGPSLKIIKQNFIFSSNLG